jgi:lysozyme
MRGQYYPTVLRAFAGHDLSEIQLAAALSFEWHYGAIRRAEWVADWCAGKRAEARDSFMNWTDRGNAAERADIEQGMFFDGVWPEDLCAPVYSVAKPSYRPVNAKRVDVLPLLTRIICGEPD